MTRLELKKLHGFHLHIDATAEVLDYTEFDGNEANKAELDHFFDDPIWSKIYRHCDTY